MKTIASLLLSLTCVITIPNSGWAQATTENLEKLRKQYNIDSEAALKPIVLRYVAQLQSLHRIALQKGDARGAVEIEEEVKAIREKTKIEIPASNLPGAVAPPPTADDNAKKLYDTRWSDGSTTLTIHADGSITSTSGDKGTWRLIGNKFLLQWPNGKRAEEWKIDAAVKLLTHPNGNKFTLLK